MAVAERPSDLVVQLARLSLARRHLADFCALTDPSYEPAEHTRVLCEHLESVERGDIKRLAVFMPPRHSKTYHTSIRFPAWCLGRNPRRQFILASYAAELAEYNSRAARNILSHPSWPFDTRLAGDSSAANRWQTSEGGVVIAAGVGGAITGFGADVLIIDDPIKNREEADSEVIREKAYAWYQDVARTRLMPGGSIVLQMTRWHEDDLAGRVLESATKDRWTVLTLPAVAEDASDALSRPIGAALWPEWYDEEALEDIKEDISTRSWLALYQQRPSAEEGAMFKRDWFSERYDSLPKMTRTIQTVDSAFKTNITNDPSVIATWGTDGINYYLINIWRRRAEFPELMTAVRDQYAEYRPEIVLIEDTAAGQSVIQQLRSDSRIPVAGYKVTASKEARAGAVTPLARSLKVRLPALAHWVDEWIEEHVSFPTGKHDDQVDTTSAALKELSEGQARAMPKASPVTMGRAAAKPRGRAWQ